MTVNTWGSCSTHRTQHTPHTPTTYLCTFLCLHLWLFTFLPAATSHPLLHAPHTLPPPPTIPLAAFLHRPLGGEGGLPAGRACAGTHTCPRSGRRPPPTSLKRHVANVDSVDKTGGLGTVCDMVLPRYSFRRCLTATNVRACATTQADQAGAPRVYSDIPASHVPRPHFTMPLLAGGRKGLPPRAAWVPTSA